ncbi:hypothetical protein BDQ17DRAFT_1483723 [Cyathus striatus]|nr:hypothetical protein BDQ17DRAFT_1260571 [Cyathus striatus]KAF8987711.1 hypothetical protein BDQ17DRAFT_1483723 [Cyathus striatus]
MDIPFFSGRPQDDELSAEEYVKSFRGKMLILRKTEEDIITIFGAFMKAGSPAEKWYELPTTPKSSWSELTEAFLLRFPFTIGLENSPADWERELISLSLKPEDLLKEVPYGSASVLSHIAFAYNALELAQNAELADGSTYIGYICGNLPEALRDRLEAHYDSWAAFTDAIVNIKITHIREGIERNAKFEALQRQIELF